MLDCLWSESADFHETDFRRRPDRNTSRILFLFFRNRPLILFHMLATKSRLLNSFAALLTIIIKMPFYIFADTVSESVSGVEIKRKSTDFFRFVKDKTTNRKES